jgi:hypothetical protein
MHDAKCVPAAWVDSENGRCNGERSTRIFRRRAIVAIVDPRLHERRILPLVLHSHGDVAGSPWKYDACGPDDDAGMRIERYAGRCQGTAGDGPGNRDHW